MGFEKLKRVRTLFSCVVQKHVSSSSSSFIVFSVHNHISIIFQAIMEEANRCGHDIVKLKDILSSILLICKVFYSLNFQVSMQFCVQHSTSLFITNECKVS